MSSPRSALRLAVLASAILLAACASERTPIECMTEFTRAVQDRDPASLFCLSAGAAGEASLGDDPAARLDGFTRWFDAEVLAYEEGRDAGQLALTGHGVRLAKLFSLGRGTYYREVGRTAVGEGGLLLRTRLDFAYAQIDLSGLSPGTTFYLAASPVGSVVPVVLPSTAREIEVEALETVMVDWTLLREAAADGCPAGYKVASVEPVAGSERTRSFTWVF